MSHKPGTSKNVRETQELREELQKRLRQVRADVDEREREREEQTASILSKKDEDEKRRIDQAVAKARLQKADEAKHRQKLLEQYEVLWSDLQEKLRSIKEEQEEELRKAEKEQERIRRREEEDYLRLTAEERERLQAEKEAQARHVAEVRERLRLQAIEQQKEQAELSGKRDKLLAELKEALVLKLEEERARERLAEEEAERRRKHEEEIYQSLPEKERDRVDQEIRLREIQIENLRLKAAKEKEQRCLLEQQQQAMIWDLKDRIEKLKERKRLKTETETEEDRAREAKAEAVRAKKAKIKKDEQKQEQIVEMEEMFRKAKKEKARAYAAKVQKSKRAEIEERRRRLKELVRLEIQKAHPVIKVERNKEQLQDEGTYEAVAIEIKESYPTRKEKIRLRAEHLRTIMEENEKVRAAIEEEERLHSSLEESPYRHSTKEIVESHQIKPELKEKDNYDILVEKISSNSAMDVYEHSGILCRICGAEVPYDAPLVMCNCTDTLVHKECLEDTLRVACSDTCDLCGYKFTLKREPWYSIPKAIFVWIIKDSCKTQLLLTVLLSSLVVSETVLCLGWASEATRTTDLQYWSADCWSHVARRLEMPRWKLLLAVLAVCRQAALLSLLLADNVASFCRYYCASTTVSIHDVVFLSAS